MEGASVSCLKFLVCVYPQQVCDNLIEQMKAAEGVTEQPKE